MWEDENNKNGGRIALKLRKEYSNLVWEELVFAFIGGYFAKEIKDTNKILRVSKELKKRTDHYKNEELRMFQEIKKQETVVDDLKTSSQAKMESVVKAGKKAEFASFKNAQEEINKLIEEQEKLMALKDYLKRVKLNKASVKKRLVVSVKQDLMQNYYRKEK